MKKLFRRPAVLAVLLVAAYLFGLLLGLFAIVIYPVHHRQKGAMLSRAQSIAAEYDQGVTYTMDYIKSATMRILIYSPDGTCLQNVTIPNIHKEPQDETAIHTYLQPYLAQALSGETQFALAPSYETPRNWTNYCMVAGVPIQSGGAVILVKFLENLQEAYLGYLVYFSVFYWITVYCVITYHHKKKKLDEAQRTYIANVTHALKSPLASVKSITETLSDIEDLPPEKRMVYYGIILRETNLQSHMVQEILELSRIQNHGTDFSKTTVCADEVFQPVLEKFSTLCDCARISFRIPDDLSRLPPLYTNAAYIAQIMDILLENAVKYVNSGDHIQIHTVQAKTHLIFCVQDDGCGISKEDLPHVFERFYRCNSNVKDSSGLGLAIAKEIADHLGEKIWAESELGRGSRFCFTVHTK